MARETWVQSQVESYQRLKKWYLMPPCLTLSIIRYGSRVKWSNPGRGVAPSPTPWCSKLSKREPSGHPRLWSPTLLTYKSIRYPTNSKSYRENHVKLESGIDSRRKKFNWGWNPERYIPGRWDALSSLLFVNVTQSHNQEIAGGYMLSKL